MNSCITFTGHAIQNNGGTSHKPCPVLSGSRQNLFLKCSYPPDHPSLQLFWFESPAATILMTMRIQQPVLLPTELFQLMSQLLLKKVDPSFSMFLPFYTDSGRNSHPGKKSSSIPAAVCRIRDKSLR